MATPLTGLQRRDGGLGLMAGPANGMDSSPSKGCLKSSAVKSPILIFSLFHKAIRSELDGLHRAAMDFATNQDSDINTLLERYHFFRAIYKHHCNAEDEVVSFFISFAVLNPIDIEIFNVCGISLLFSFRFSFFFVIFFIGEPNLPVSSLLFRLEEKKGETA